MDVDPDIAPLMAQTRDTMDRIEKELLPLLAELDEDAIVSHYSLDEQARLFLASAFAMAFSLYSLDKLNHRQHQAIQMSGAGATGKRRTQAQQDTLNPNVDAQLLLKIDRITDYIKKLREITDLAKRQQTTQQTSPQDAETKPEAKESKGTEEAAASRAGGKAAPLSGQKRGREEAAETATAETADDMGDAAMFGVVSRVPGETGVVVGRLLRHVTGASAEKNN